MAPKGGNQVFVDGSARWIKFATMYFLTSWENTTRIAYFYQDSSDFDPALKAALPALQARP